MNPDQINKMYNLFDSVREGVITDEQFAELDQLLAQSKRVCKYYHEYLSMCSILKSGKAIDEDYTAPQNISPAVCDMQLWDELLKEEETAPTVVLPKPKKQKPKREPVQVGPYPKIERKLSKFTIYSAVASIAALIFIVIFVKVVPNPITLEVATLSNTLNAVWDKPGTAMENEARLITGRRPLKLQSGFAELLFDNRTKVTVEAPAEFILRAENKIRLNHGKLYVTVPDEAHGFTIDTEHAQIVDLGTEFGVYKPIDGDITVHVMKGKVRMDLVAAEQTVSQILTQAQAAVVTTERQVQAVSYEEDLFVRDIVQQQILIQRQTTHFCLADVVAGGDGFSGTTSQRGIVPASGRISAKAKRFQNRFGKEGNKRVNDSEYIDSVFIPDDGPIWVSSAKHRYRGFNDTNQYYWSDITPDVRIPTNMATNNKPQMLNEIFPVLKGKTYGGSQNDPAILISPNAGITFDLNKIRNQCSGKEIVSFNTICGIPENTQQSSEKIRFWIMIDGNKKAVFKAEPAGEKTQNLQIPITPADQYLSLVTTIEGTNSRNCWALFAEPKLILEKK